MIASRALAALTAIAFSAVVLSQPIPEVINYDEMEEDMGWPGFDISQIPFGRSCTPGMKPMGGDMMGGDMMPGGDMMGGDMMPGGDMMGGDMMQHHNIPCIKCGCMSTDDYDMEHEVRCHLMPGGEMCSMMEQLRMKLSMRCEPGKDFPVGEDMPCGCKCNDNGRWECWSKDMEGQPPNSQCLFLENHRFIELPLSRVKDLSVLYPQHCETSDGGWVLHGEYRIHDNCNVCLCFDGVFKCKQKMEFCNENGMLKQEAQEALSCSDRSGPVFPLGTYVQNGPHYRMCVFGHWMDALFTAAIKKAGRCPRMEWSDEMEEMPEKPTCDEGKKHECIHDIHCEGRMKCCMKQCGGECVMPEFHMRNDGMDWDQPEGMDGESDEGMDREKPDWMEERDKDEHMMRPMPCNLTNGEVVPSGIVYHPTECKTCVCLNGTTKCYEDENCGKAPTCSCGPPGTDMAAMPDMPKMAIPYGTLWHTSECSHCVCLDGDWHCKQKNKCKPSVPIPRSCQVSETHNMSVPTGHTSANGCCICINGLWTCESPECNNDEQFQAQGCGRGNIMVRNGAYHMKECKMCVCVNGNEMCTDICMMKEMKDKMKDKKMGMMEGGMMDGDGSMISQQEIVMMKLKGMCPDMMFQCQASEERMDFCTTDADCEMLNSTCCSNGCFKFCMKPNPDGSQMSCPEQMCPPNEGEFECTDDNHCPMEGAVCCRDWNGCYGKCVMAPTPQQPPKAGLCPLHDPPTRFDMMPFPWDNMKKMMMMMMMMMMQERGGMGGDMDGDMPQWPPMDGNQRPPMEGDQWPPMDGNQRPPMDGDQWPPMDGDMAGEWSNMFADWEELFGMFREWNETSGGSNDHMGMDPFQRWFHGDCFMDSDCDGDMKCCGHIHKQCIEPLEQPEADHCVDSKGVSREHGYVEVGERNADWDFCLTCLCVDGKWLCEKLTCLEDSPTPVLADCPGNEMGEMVPTGTGAAKQCMAVACFNGNWLKRPLAACVKAKKGKEGMCPRPDGNRRECTNDMSMSQCRIDDDCSGDMKCCFDGCTLSCANPKEVHPGVCPRPTIMELMMQEEPCVEDQGDMCLSDGECGGDQKCCYNGCHKTCEQSEEMDMKMPGCMDPEDPTGLPYISGQTITKGDCDICVCVGTEWMCSDVQDCADNPGQSACPIDGGKRTVPSGTLHTESCLHRVCLNGEWQSKLSPMCCPMAPKPCMMDGTMIASGTYMTNPESCKAWFCLNGFIVIKKLDSNRCTSDTVDVPSCWAGKFGDKEFLTGEMKKIMDKKCVCLFGDWRCGSAVDMKKERDMKSGVCPAEFDLIEKATQGGRNMSMEGMGMMGDDKREGRMRSGRWGQGGLPERLPMDDDEAGGLFETVSDWITPPDMMQNAGGWSGGDGERGMSGIDGERPGSGWGGGPPVSGDGGEGPMPAGGGGGRPPMPAGGGGGRPPMPAGGGGGRPPMPAGGGGGWPLPAGGGGDSEDQRKPYDGGRSRPDDRRDQRRRGSSMDDYMRHTHMLVDFVQGTRFDGCRMDADCDGKKICCGSKIGGACIKPEPKEALPLPCKMEDEYIAHGTVHHGEKDGICKACACIHGTWECDELDCANTNEELEMCSVGPPEAGLKVPSGAQQFLQCQMCVCLNGDWKCSERTCSNKGSDALCPAHLPPDIYVADRRCDGNMDCKEREKCCEYKNYGKVCVPTQRPTERNGECPAEIDEPCESLKECLTDSHCPGMMKCCRHMDALSTCDISVGRGVCVKPSGNPCPGGAMSYTPCADVNPCEHVGNCSSDPSLTCQIHECGGCKAVFVDQNGRPAKCEDHAGSRCDIPKRGRSVPLGTTFDKPQDPCQSCVCKRNGKLNCTKDRDCGEKQKRLEMKFKSNDCSPLDDEMRHMQLVRDIGTQVAARVGINANGIKDIDVKCGSFDVSMTIVQNPAGVDESIDVDAVANKLLEAEEELILIFEGEEHSSEPGSVKEVHDHKGMKDHKIMVIAPVVGVVVVAFIIAVTVCWVKSSNQKRDGDIKA